MKLESSPSLEYPGDDEGHKLQALGSPYSGAPADGRSLGDIIQNGVVVPPGLSLIVDPYNEEVCDAALQTDYLTLPPLKCVASLSLLTTICILNVLTQAP